MQSTLEKQEKNLVSLEFVAEPAEVEEALEQAYKKVVKKVSIPGFRKGKVPRRVLESHYGKEVLYEDAMEILVSRGYREALDEYQLEPIDQPKLEIIKGLEEGNFVFKAEVEVLPEVELGEYKGLKVEKKETDVSEQDVEEELRSLQERHAELVVVEKEAVENGDFAVIDFDGYIDGEPFPGGSAQGYTVEVGGGRFIPGFEENIIGMKPGEEKTIKTTFPEDYHNKEVAGREVEFKVKLHEIKNKELPELDDEFAKSLGHGETVTELKADIRKHMEQYAEQQAQREFEQKVVEKVVEGSKVELPEVLIDRELDNIIHNIEHDLARRGLKLEQYLQSRQQTEEDLKKELKPQAEIRVKTDLVLSAIAKAEGIEAIEEEIDEEIEKSIQYYPENQKEKLRKRMKNPNVLEGIKESIVKDKVIKWLGEVSEPVPVKEEKDEENKENEAVEK